MNQVVPIFTSRRQALRYLSWYYKQTWWKELRPIVYHHYQGICCKCGTPIPFARGWSIHHEKEAYNHLWHEDTVIDLVKLVHTTCHKEIEETKKEERKEKKKEQRASLKVRQETMTGKRKTFAFIKRKSLQ